MQLFEKISLLALRVSLGWIFFYAGITKILNPEWTSAGYLNSAKTFSGFFGAMATSDALPIIDLVNEWGLTFLGISLILGLFVRYSSFLGALLMIFYYLPGLDFPHPNPNSYIIDEHLVYAFVLLYFAAIGAGRKTWGLDNHLPNTTS